jgi:cytochrome oxidase Cu insertion factor (SCO1/SenC/PrrC family)
MHSAPQHLEPAVRDPRKLRRTAWILVAIMIIGGVLILRAYDRFAADKAHDDRPAFVANRLTKEKDLRVIRQDGSQAELFDLAGKISVVHSVSAERPETAARTAEVIGRLAAHYADEPDVTFVSLVLDPVEPELVTAQLAAAADSLGAALPQWWVATTDPLVVRKWVKKEFKASVTPHQRDEAWVFDTSVVLVDRNRHLRRAVVPQKQGGPPYTANFDFDQAAEWDDRGVKTGTDRSNVEELEALLIRTIDQLLAETAR